MPTALECRNVSKNFDGVHALRGVSLAFETAKIHVVLGQNGAGKSTLARVFSGLVHPDSGEMQFFAKDVPFHQPAASHAAGLDIVHQQFALPPTLSVAEALEFASARKLAGRFYSKRRIEQAWGDKMKAAGIDVDPATPLSRVPVETAQSIEILRALSNDTKILILDEPTALLSPGAIAALFRRLQDLSAQGVTIIVVLHKLKEVMEVADTVSILRQGSLVLPPTPRSELSEAKISDLMIGAGRQTPTDSTRSEQRVRTDVGPHRGDVLISMSNVVSARRGVEPGLHDVSLDLRAGEILGVAGVEGNGQRALAEVLAGIDAPLSGQIRFQNDDMVPMNANTRRRAGLRSIPFDRMVEGCSLTQPLWENTTVWRAQDFAARYGGIVSTRAMQGATRDALDGSGVVYGDVKDAIGQLSGGNVQKVILAREFSGTVKVVIAAQPTRGLDFAATDFVWSELRRLRDEGAGVILISSDLDDLFEISDTVVAVQSGRITQTFTAPFSRQAVGDAMVGATR